MELISVIQKIMADTSSVVMYRLHCRHRKEEKWKQIQHMVILVINYTVSKKMTLLWLVISSILIEVVAKKVSSQMVLCFHTSPN